MNKSVDSSVKFLWRTDKHDKNNVSPPEGANNVHLTVGVDKLSPHKGLTMCLPRRASNVFSPEGANNVSPPEGAINVSLPEGARHNYIKVYLGEIFLWSPHFSPCFIQQLNTYTKQLLKCFFIIEKHWIVCFPFIRCWKK